MSKKIVVVYHSGFGHTKVVADHILKGLQGVNGIQAEALSVTDILANEVLWGNLTSSDAIIFGTPTYMGTVSAEFKKFMDASSGVWYKQQWKDKFAAGFTNSAGLSGDKLNTLQTLSIFAAQHSMAWISQGIMPSGHGENDSNRLGGWLGLMVQSENAPADQTPSEADKKYAELFGQRIAKFLIEKTK